MNIYINIAYNWLLEVNRKMEVSTNKNGPSFLNSGGPEIVSNTETNTETNFQPDSTTILPESSVELWSFSNAILFIISLLGVIFAVLFSQNLITNIDRIKGDWANQRCNPLYMPFASMFGENTKENFEYCMGSIFELHSLPFIGSITSMFSQFTGLLTSIFDSISSMRNVIATLGGGINVIFQEFTDRITTFFFKLRMSAISIKSLFARMYAILFSVMYMGMSGITGMTSFTNTSLFSFLDTFCFPGNTELIVEDGYRSIKDIKIGDILLPGKSRVTATFRFYSRGQPMVQLGKTIVSTNHYIMYQGKPIKAGKHPYAISLGGWNSDEPLYCLNTDTHTIPVDYLTFMDYDETPDGDKDTMNFIDGQLNACHVNKKYPFKESGFGIEEDAIIKTSISLVKAKDIKIGDKLSTGSEVVGVIRKEVNEICKVEGVILTPSTLYWKKDKWSRYGEDFPIIHKKLELVSFVVVPNSQIELENGTRVRDYMELCSPDAEIHYSKCLEKN